MAVLDNEAGKLENETVDKEESCGEVGLIFSLELNMLPNNLPFEASHSSLDLYERSPLLNNFDASFEQKIGPLYAPNGPRLEFEVTGDRTNFIDLQNIYLEVKCKILQSNGNDLRYDATSTANSDLPCFVNNSLHSLFADCNIKAEGVQVSSSNGNYARKAFIETEFCHNQEAKNTWLKCQGYSYEKSPNTFTEDVFTRRIAETRESKSISCIGKVASDFFSCEKYLLSGVTLRITFLRNRPEFCLIYDTDAKDYKVEISQANLYVRKMTVTEHNFAAIETTLTKSNAFYHYTEIIPKTFLVSIDTRSWNHEDIFNHEPIRRFALVMVTNEAFLGAKTVNPFHFQKFDLQSITVYRNGYPIAGTPLQTEDDKKLYLNSLEALQFKAHGHGVPFDDYMNPYVLVFDLTSTQQASYDYLYPELTNTSISVDLRFKSDLGASVELFFLGEKASTLYINCDRQVSKNRQLNNKIEK